MTESVDKQLRLESEKDSSTLIEQSVQTAEGSTAVRRPFLVARFLHGLYSLYCSQCFLFNILFAILLAYAYPPLGAIYLAPQITASWIAVIFIFLLSGLGLKTDELKKAFQRIFFNLFVQCFNFGVVSVIVYGLARLIIKVKIVSEDLGDGLIICSCLPITINMVLVLTKSAGGDEAAAVFNAALSSLLGVFISPALILIYVGVKGHLSLIDLFYKLALRVVLPIVVGQLLQKFVRSVSAFVVKYKKHFKTAQEHALVFTVYTVFSKSFSKGTISTASEILIMMVFEAILICFIMVLAWFTLRLLFPSSPELRVMGLFGCTHKSIAVGIPLINAIYETSPHLGLYTLPLLIWHPGQLIFGSALVPSLVKFVERERERLDVEPSPAASEVV